MPTISWWEPRWGYARRLVRSYRAVLRAQSLARVLVVSVVLSGAIWGAFRAFYPALDWRPLLMMLVAVPGLFAAMGFNILIVPLLIPPNITIKHETIRYYHGNGSNWTAPFADCRQFRLILLPNGARRLRFRHNARRRALGISPKVDQTTLRNRLPSPVRVIDARRRVGLGGRR